MNKARTFAVMAHGNQMYGKRPYAFHLDAVANLLRPFGKMAVTVGYLHDVVEDTHITVAQVQREFDDLVAGCVALLTDEPGADRKERKVKTYEKLSRVSGEMELALTVKVADRLANVMACVADKKTDLLVVYRSEHEAFYRAAFRPDTCDELWLELNSYLNVSFESLGGK